MSETVSSDKPPLLIEGEFIKLDVPDRESLSDAFFRADSIELFQAGINESLPKPLQSANLKFRWVKSTDTLDADGVIGISPRFPKESGTTWLESLRHTLASQLSESGHTPITFDHDPLAVCVQLDDTYIVRITPTAELGLCSVDISLAKIEDIEDEPWYDQQLDTSRYTFSPVDIMLDTTRLFNLTLNTVVQKYGDVSITNPVEATTLKANAKIATGVAAVKSAELELATKTATADKEPQQRPWSEVSFDNIGGLTTQRDFLMDMADILANPDLARECDLRPNHVLLHGPDGTGKHSLVRAFCNEIGGTLTTMRSTAVASSAKAFQDAYKATTPQVILIENLDMAGKATGGSALPIERQVLGTYLEEASAHYPHVIIIALTNESLDTIDPALINPERFVTLPVELPTVAEREDIWRVMTTVRVPLESALDEIAQQGIDGSLRTKTPYAEQLDYDTLATMSGNMTGLDIKSVLEKARLQYMKQRLRKEEAPRITTELLLELIEAHQSAQPPRQ